MDTQIPGPPTTDARLLERRVESLERELASLTRSNTNSPRFWTRALAIVGHQLAIWGILYAALIVIALIATAAGSNT